MKRINLVLLDVGLFLTLSISLFENNFNFATFTFGINGLLIILFLHLSSKKYPYSLESIYFIFVFFFFVVAPLLQLSENAFRYGYSPNSNELIFLNFIILLWNCGLIIGIRIFKPIKIHSLNTPNVNLDKRYIMFLTLINIILFIFSIFFINNNLFIRGNLNNQIYFIFKSAMLTSIFKLFLHTFPTILLSFLIIRNKFDRKNLLYFSINLIIFLVLCLPI